MTVNRYEQIFGRVVENYVQKYKEHSFDITLDEKKLPRIGDSPNVVKVRITDAGNVLQRIFTEGSLGLGEAYCEGRILVDDELYKYFLLVLVRTAHNWRLLLSLPAADIFYVLRARFRGDFFEKETKSENINAHYSLSDWFDNEKDSNDFFLYWLNSKYILYTCGKWDENIRTLEESQENKLRFYAKRLGIDQSSKGKTLVDLGCGWGGCMFYMAERFGVKCKGITLSTAQAEYVREEIKKRNLQNLVSVEVDDIHNVRGVFDYVISIGVMEAIHNHDHLYHAIAHMLNKNGSALVHSMFHTEMFYEVDPFLSKYIFPGGAVPNFKKNIRVFRKYFRHVDINVLPENSYPKTLDCWYRNFCQNETAIRKLLAEKSKVKDIDFSIRVFKHYLMLAYCGLSDNYTVVANVLVRK